MHLIETTLIVVGATLAGSKIFKMNSVETSTIGAVCGFTVSNMAIYAKPFKEALRAKEGAKILAVTSATALMMELSVLAGAVFVDKDSQLAKTIDNVSAAFHKKLPPAHRMLTMAAGAAASLAFGNFIASAVSR